ncbi:MAG: hypothetical protein HOG46_05280 [Gammaproteobacteria bacterium]|nr:hypothetical protein [Gammaproteobacteria bacterium]MBT5643783.1 hypothetical protein [Gammaproteobacteria bacterium]MBT6734720.1 hypothetical protein [Gammaproteobacteria bacterium]|tara:strand:- start:80 stop:508 length:429 start_codon:yes stop_codon:yes gene_type:complete
MNISIGSRQADDFRIMNFDHLMKIYENNYYLFKKVIATLSDSSSVSTIVFNNNVMQYEPITISKYTDIFKFYYKYKSPFYPGNSYSIKSHLVFTLYKDARLLEVKSLGQNKDFDENIDNKIRINLNIYFWLKSILMNNDIYQ